MTALAQKSLLPVLLVEDSPEDYEVTVRGLRKAGLASPIHRCEDGDDALDYLRRRGQYAGLAQSPRPGVILLDLNMPGTDGYEVLAEIKSDEDLKVIPVVVLTTSSNESDIERCYRAGANSYVRKPVNLESFMDAVHRLAEYWFAINILPRAWEQPE